jgi:hypothetical protein
MMEITMTNTNTAEIADAAADASATRKRTRRDRRDRRAEIAKQVGVSVWGMRQARAVQQYRPDLAERVKDGTLTLTDALRQIRHEAGIPGPLVVRLPNDDVTARIRQLASASGAATAAVVRELLVYGLDALNRMVDDAEEQQP